MKKEELFLAMKRIHQDIDEINITFEGNAGSFNDWIDVSIIKNNPSWNEEYLEGDKKQEIIKLTNDFIWDSIFAEADKQPDWDENGTSGNISFYLNENKIRYSITYFNNPDDFSDWEYEEDCEQDF